MPDLYLQAEIAILEPDPIKKCEFTRQLSKAWERGELTTHTRSEILPIDDPGRPRRPTLVDPRRLQRRGFSSEVGRVRLLHAFAHIEFNAINIALDAVYRFRQMPRSFASDWLQVATEEAKHFQLLATELKQRGSYYGEFEAHRGLWDMVCKTRNNLLHRMALVPRVMEARGLDVTPAMITRFAQFDDDSAVSILQTIYRDEVGHVRIGNYWYRRICSEQGLDPEATFRQLIDCHMDGKLRGPFNWAARIEAGFAAGELEALERLG
ncbi:MAG: ferritin-like domain-containing protein [Gammaproteobacteria bacterium]|nr:ferritin-like domain-containing protein [Gammaproteobacteria bacterium]MDH3447358.1 ferritin-like domain-containing protein [Gammaproteobacteria bacterium]